MARIPTLNKFEGLSEAQQKAYQAISATRGGVRGPFGILLHNPELAVRTAHLGAYIRFESSLNPQTLVVAALVTARLMDSEFEFSANADHAKDAGVEDTVIDAIRDRTAPRGLSEEQALVLRLGTELLTGKYRISNKTYAAALKQFGLQGLIDLVSTFGYYAQIACVLNAFEMEPRPGHPPLSL